VDFTPIRSNSTPNKSKRANEQSNTTPRATRSGSTQSSSSASTFVTKCTSKSSPASSTTLQVHTSSTNHTDQKIYDPAFFAKEDIPAGTELTFDYKDEDDRAVITEEMADKAGRLKSYRPAKCLCGTERCRGYFFT